MANQHLLHSIHAAIPVSPSPAPQLPGWKRILLRFDNDPDLLIIALLTGPFKILWSLLTGKSARD